jgi:hypothetical protein
MKLSDPIIWAIIGAFFGFFAAIGGQNEYSPILDGIIGALIQSTLWFSVSWVIIKILKNYPIKKHESQSKVIGEKSNKWPLRLWFLIAYSAPTIGALVSEWSNAGSSYGIPIDFIGRLSNLSNAVFSLAGFIDIFIFPSLASAMTVTSAIFFYRKSYSKLKNKKNKHYLVGVYVVATIILWVLLSVLLAMLVSRN